VNNPLSRLHEFGQSIWLDSISRRLLRTGQLKNLMESDRVTGVTSNPTIFENAIGETDDYDSDMHRLHDQGESPEQIYLKLAIEDVREASDLLRREFDRTDGLDGYVSLEVSPNLAHDTRGTIEQAKALWRAVDRPNVMIKIPGTKEGLPAIRQCIADGLNINVTLLFGLERYRDVAEAYIRGLESRVRRKEDLHGVRSVASFFLSRIDVLIDPMLEVIAGSKVTEDEAPPAPGSEWPRLAAELRGAAAIASAKIAYQIYQEIVSTERFRKLERQGARRQWLLWASTSTKSKEYSDVKYVEPLIGPETINTMPLETMEAYRDHGNPMLRMDKGVDKAQEVMRSLREVGIDLAEITQQLEDQGVEKFVKAFDKLMEQVEHKIALVSAH
jgi:transaldolase